MENNEEMTLSEVKRLVAELKASILKLDALNQEVANNITQLQDLNSKMKDYTSIISKFEFKNEQELTANYASYLAFLSKKLDEFSTNKNLKRLEVIVSSSNNIVSLSIAKLAASITICVSAFYIVTKLN